MKVVGDRDVGACGYDVGASDGNDGQGDDHGLVGEGGVDGGRTMSLPGIWICNWRTALARMEQ